MSSVLHITEVIKGGIASYIDELYLYHKKDNSIKFKFYISKQEIDELKFVDKKLIYTLGFLKFENYIKTIILAE